MPNQDQILVERAKRNPSEFGALYKKYVKKIYNYFWFRVGHDNETAEDLMQDTFLRAFRDLQRYQASESSYLTYLVTIAHNRLVNYYRVPRPISLESVGDIPYDVIKDIQRKLAAETLWRAVQQLPLSEKDALIMFYREELPIKEISRAMDKSENAIKLILSRARKKLALHPSLAGIAEFGYAKRSAIRPKFMEEGSMR